jgi:hypothetical protein
MQARVHQRQTKTTEGNENEKVKERGTYVQPPSEHRRFSNQLLVASM